MITPKSKAYITTWIFLDLNEEEIELILTHHVMMEQKHADKREYMAAQAHRDRREVIQGLLAEQKKA